MIENNSLNTVLVPTRELDEMDKFLLHLLDAPEFISDVENLIEENGTTGENYYSSGIAEITELDIEEAVTKTFEFKYGTEFSVPTVIYEYVAENINRKKLKGIEEEILEQAKEAQEFQDNPLGYHGMSKKDFI